MKSELGRQIFHMIIGSLIILSLLFFEKKAVLIVLFLIFLLSVLISLLSLKIKLPIISYLLKHFETNTRQIKFPGKGFVFFIAGSLLTIKLFPQNIALAALVVLTFGDSISTITGLFGQKYKKRPFNKLKSLRGTLYGMAISFLIALFFVPPIFAVVAAVFGMLVEAITIRLGEEEADDNLIIPLAAGTACYLLTLII